MTELLKMAIASGQVSADQIESHRAAGDLLFKNDMRAAAMERAGELPIVMFEPRFQHTYCSQCGMDCGPGDEGFSSCHSHQVRGLASAIAQPAAPVQRQPLTDEQIDSLICNAGILDCLQDPYDKYQTGDTYGSVAHDIRRVARAIEAAHNITENRDAAIKAIS